MKTAFAIKFRDDYCVVNDSEVNEKKAENDSWWIEYNKNITGISSLSPSIRWLLFRLTLLWTHHISKVLIRNAIREELHPIIAVHSHLHSIS